LLWLLEKVAGTEARKCKTEEGNRGSRNSDKTEGKGCSDGFA
jgi:hypothetical protein